ncbi:DHBP synthase RibB-like alpha/beta domain-containing protein [Entophlyctis helioformis]|nr:DHBP synthase RibB-like alpha/beta domain-containing protein [Entophlyctis helioformis]
MTTTAMVAPTSSSSSSSPSPSTAAVPPVVLSGISVLSGPALAPVPCSSLAVSAHGRFLSTPAAAGPGSPTNGHNTVSNNNSNNDTLAQPHTPAQSPLRLPVEQAPAVLSGLAGIVAVPGLVNAVLHVSAPSALGQGLETLIDPAVYDPIALATDAVWALVRSGTTTIVLLIDHQLSASFTDSPASVLNDRRLAGVLVPLVNSQTDTLLYRSVAAGFGVRRLADGWAAVRDGVETRIATEASVSAFAACGLVGSGNMLTGVTDLFALLGRQLRLSAAAQTSGVDGTSLLRTVSVDAARVLGLDSTGSIAQDGLADYVLVKMAPHWTTKDTASAMLAASPAGLEVVAVFKHGRLVHAAPDFSNAFQAATMSRYYDRENAPAASTAASAVPSVVANGSASQTTHIAPEAGFDSIESALEDYRNGKFLVVVDNEDRENEGDLIIAGEDFTPEKAAFMIRYTSGVICAPASGDILDRLELPLMVPNNTDSFKTAYTISLDLKQGTTTGISAADRAATVRAMADPSSVPAAFSRPGHVFPLRAVPGGVLKRVGHTEASVDLCRLAGKRPVAAICEIVLDDGRMARRDDLRAFSNKFGLRMITIHDLVQYRMKHGL